MFFVSSGPFIGIALCSVEALEEFKSAVQQNFERSDKQKHVIGKSALKAFTFLRSTEDWNTRRKYMMS